MSDEKDFELELEGLSIFSITLATLIKFCIGENCEHTLNVERSFEITNGSITVVEYAPWYDVAPRGMDELISLVSVPIASSIAYADGSLVLGFVNGKSMRVGFDPQYEAWSLANIKGVLVSLPGGGLG